MSHSKIIVALDYLDEKPAKKLVESLNPELCRLKVGKALFTASGPSFIKYLIDRNFDVFLDLKFHDIPKTVHDACLVCAQMGVWMLTVHTSGGLEMLLAAKQAVDNSEHKPLIMGVTVLTSFDQGNLISIGVNNTLQEQVIKLAGLAYQAQIDGIVCSAHEASLIKQEFDTKLKILTPGIRFNQSNKHDQKRTMSPEEAIKAGSNYLVIGREITQADKPSLALESIFQSINK